MSSSGYQRLFAELKRRKVFRVAAVYGAVAFVVLQVADILVPALRLPEGFTTGVALVAILTFPIALVLAWAFETTPEGVRRTDPAATAEIEAIVAQPASRRWPSGLLALVGVVALAAGGWLALTSRGAGPGGTGAGEVASLDRAFPPTDSARTIAVLPFASLTDDEESREFALGIHDDLLTQLSRIDDLRVTSRTSVMTYAGSDKPVREIAGELGVGTIVEGGVRTAAGQVRINVQLIDAATDEHIWAETFDRELTAANVFAVQAEIARAVSSKLEAELSPSEGMALAEIPTGSLEAWTAYHRGRRLWERSGEEAAERQTVAELRRAVQLDPELVPAWSFLVRAETWLLRRGLESDTMPARRSLDRLLELAPDAPETRLATGYYRYYARADFSGALPEFEAYRRSRPGDADGLQFSGYVLRRLGRWDESTTLMEQSLELDPRNAGYLWNLAQNFRAAGRLADAERVVRKAIEIVPESSGPRLEWLVNELFARGDVGQGPALAFSPPGFATPEGSALGTYWASEFARDHAAAIRALLGVTESGDLAFPGSGGRFQELPRSLLLALAYRFDGDSVRSREWADTLVATATRTVSERPVPPAGDRFASAAIARSMLSLGLALRGEPGDAEEAVRLADESVRIYGPERDAVDGGVVAHARVWTNALLGRTDEALRQIEELGGRGDEIGYGELRHLAVYDRIREDPRFEALVRRAEAKTRN
jgi:TolB-like protein